MVMARNFLGQNCVNLTDRKQETVIVDELQIQSVYNFIHLLINHYTNQGKVWKRTEQE